MWSRISKFLKNKPGLAIGILCFVILMSMRAYGTFGGPEDTPYPVVVTAITDRQVAEATLYDSEQSIHVKLKDGRELQTLYVEGAGLVLQEQMRANQVPFVVKPGTDDWFLRMLGAYGVPLFIGGLLLLAIFIGGRARQHKMQVERPTIRFSDVKGADEAIQKLEMLRRLITEPKRYGRLKPARGVLLNGESGVGKTFLAQALAGEAGVPFFRTSGSDLVSGWGGRTSSKIKTMFTTIRQLFPDRTAAFIVFIDEFDGIGGKRTGGANADRDKDTSVATLLNETGRLLQDYPHAILIAATNHPDRIDPALRNSHRFGLHITMAKPDRSARLAILQANATELNIDPVELESIADLCKGMSGSETSKIPSEAGMIAASKLGPEAPITRRHLERAAMEVAMGTPRDSAVVPEEDERIARIHESGHATLAQASPFHELLIATTIPIGESGGSTWIANDERGMWTHERVKWELAIAMGGREAEKLVNESLDFHPDLRVSTGASHDIERATRLALTMVCRGGLYPGFTTYIDMDNWEAHPRALEVDLKVVELIDEASKFAAEQLRMHAAFRRAIEHDLTDDRMLYSDELEELLHRVPLNA
jgi:ATP-dependent Zn protease